MTIRKRRAQTVVLVLGYMALAHFAIGLYHTFRLALIPDMCSTILWVSLPYIGITGIFVASVLLGHFHRLRWSTVTLVLGLFVSVAACVYDFQNHRYQITGGGIGATYTIWWWYYEPFRHGYKPGNL